MTSLPNDIRCGKLDKKHDKRTLQLASYVHLAPARRTMIPAMVPLKEFWGDDVRSWPMYRNDKVACCTCASAGHQEQVWTSEASTELVVSDDDVIAMYKAISGYDPADPSSDGGAYALDALKYWRNVGIAGHRIEAFAEVHPTHTQFMRLANHLFGGLYMGLQLPLSARDQINAGKPWDDVGDAPGGWGGHCVNQCAYDWFKGTFTCVTWGRLQVLTSRFVAAYCDEAYAIMSRDWIRQATQRAPNGIDVSALLTDLARVTA